MQKDNNDGFFPISNGVKKISAFLLSFTLLVLPVIVFAQTQSQPIIEKGLVPCGDAGQKECGFADLFVLANNIITFLIKIGLLLTMVAFAWVGWLFLTSGGNPGKRQQAIGILWKVVWGLVMMLGAWLIVNMILKGLRYDTNPDSNFINNLAR